MEHIQKSVTKMVKGLGMAKDEVEMSGLEKDGEGTCARGIVWKREQMGSM